MASLSLVDKIIASLMQRAEMAQSALHSALIATTIGNLQSSFGDSFEISPENEF